MRHLSFKAAETINRAGRVEIAIPGGENGETIAIRASTVRRRLDIRLSDFVIQLIEIGALAHGRFPPPSKFSSSIVLSAAPDLGKILGRAAVLEE